MQYDLTGKYIHIEDTFPPKEGYISKVFKKAQGKPTIGHKARVSEVPAKIQLARTCYHCWLGLKGVAPPVKPTEGSAYFKFVADVIELAGTGWSVDATLAQFRKHSGR